MHKVLSHQPHIGSYSALLALALFAGYLLSRWRAGRMGIQRPHIDNVTLLIAVMSLIGARLFSWWFYFPAGSSLWSAFTTPGAGMVFYGGLLFGGAAVVIYAAITRLSLGNLMDICAPGVALGLALGRVGCFLAGCCWGDWCVNSAEIAKLSSPELPHQVQTFPGVSRANFPLAV